MCRKRDHADRGPVELRGTQKSTLTVCKYLENGTKYNTRYSPDIAVRWREPQPVR